MVDLMQAQEVVADVLKLAAIETEDSEDQHRVYPGTMGGTSFIFVRVPHSSQSTDRSETTITFANTREATAQDLRDRLVSGLVDSDCW